MFWRLGAQNEPAVQNIVLHPIYEDVICTNNSELHGQGLAVGSISLKARPVVSFGDEVAVSANRVLLLIVVVRQDK